MDLLIDILLDAGKDTLSLLPFLLVTYLALETLEHVAGDRVNGAIKRAGSNAVRRPCRDLGHVGGGVPFDLR